MIPQTRTHAAWHLLFFCACAVFVHGGERPNVLFIVLDDLNDWTGCLGGYEGDVHTPNIDRLADRGMLFTNAHAPAPVCNPSRTATLTGLMPATTGVYRNEYSMLKAIPDVVTLPEYWQSHGYLIAGGGKLFHGASEKRGIWDRHITGKGEKKRKAPVHRKVVGRGWNKIQYGMVDGPDDCLPDMRMSENAAQFLHAQHDRPFFLAVGLYSPHLPLYAPKKYFDMYPLETIVEPRVNKDDYRDIPGGGPSWQTFSTKFPENVRREIVQAYLASISYADACIGVMLDGLAGSPYADNTVIVLWSDHGWHVGEKMRYHKMTLWEESTRVPLIFAGPGADCIARCSKPVGLIDIYPTLIELCHLPDKKTLDGRSLVALLRNPQAAWDYVALTTQQQPGRPPSYAVRSERWRYILHADGRSEELYDHAHDPYEWTNLADDPQYAGVKEKLAEWIPKHAAKPAPRRSDRPKQGKK